MDNEPGFPDLRSAFKAAGVSQARVGSHMGYRPDEFSRVMNGHQPPKGGATAEEFRAQVKDAIDVLAGNGVAA